MKAKYLYVSGAPPLSSSLVVPGHPPVFVYRFSLLKNMTRLLQDPELMKGALFGYHEKTDENGNRLYDEMNTGDFWKLGDQYVRDRVSRLGLDDGLPHYLCPVLLFADGTICDRLGRVPAHPILVSLGMICGLISRSPRAWFLQGLVPTYPKSPKEADEDKQCVGTKHLHAPFYQDCLKSILQELKELDQKQDDIKMFIHGKGYVYIHFKLADVVHA